METLRSPILAVLLLLVSVPAPARAAERLGRTVEKARAGYSVRILEDWVEIPIQPGEEILVGRFMPERETIRGVQFDVYRWPLAPAPPVAAPAAPPPADGQPSPPGDKKQKEPTDLESLAKSRDMELGEGKTLTASDRLAGTYFEIDSPWGKSLAVRFRGAAHEYGLVYRATGREYDKDYRSAFLRSAKTFKLVPIPAAPSAAVPGLPERERLRRERHARIDGIPGWYAVDTENYVILSNSEDKALIRRIASDIEKVRLLYQELFPPVRTVTALSVVRVCATQQEYNKFGGPPGTGGYWNDDPKVEELVFYNRAPNQSKRRAKKNSLSVLYHEAFHQYIYYAIGEVAPHSWYNEGHGDYFAGATPRGSGFSIEPFDWRVPVVRRLVAQDKLVPLEKFVHFSQADYYKNRSANYAQGWAFIYFLRKVAKNPDWQRIPDAYFSYLKSHLNKDETTTPAVPRPGEEPAPPTPEPPAEPKKGPPGDGGSPGDGGGGGGGGEGEDEGDMEDEELPPPPDPKKTETREKQRVLQAAVDSAFDGIDWEALEKEFRAFLKRL